MGLQDEIKQKAENWFLEKELPSIIKTGAAFLAGHMTSEKMIPILAHYGVTIDPAKLSSSIETFGSGLVVAFVAHYAVQWGHGKIASKMEDPAAPVK